MVAALVVLIIFAAGVAVGANNTGRIKALEARIVELEAKLKAKI